MKRIIATLALAAAALTASACSTDTTSAPESTTTTQAAANYTYSPPSRPATQPPVAPESTSTSPAAARNKPAGYISEATWTDGEWPFTVAEGTLMCAAPSRVTFTANRTMYAVNGAAKKAGGFDDIAAIWKSSPNGLKADLTPVIDAGLALC
ncbi:DUF2511 domain-containing protein [Bacillus safensis]|uniref:DUF2511 domain-containing protein n=1 Tax=Bacillus safensis TaxID=561879 RepID=UPI00365CC8B7